METIASIFAQLNLIFSIPARVVTYDAYKRQTVAHGRIDFRWMKAKCAVTHDGNHRSVWLGNTRSEGEG